MTLLRWLGLVLWTVTSSALALTKGFSLTEIGTHVYDANPVGQKTEAQLIVDRLHTLGVKHVTLTPRAVMTDPRGNLVTPGTRPIDQPEEAERYLRLINYIHGLGLTVGIRPIFFVVRPTGQFPYVEQQPDGTLKTWWHGNIEPSLPSAWFASFQDYLDVYLPIATAGRVEEFTVGAELESMTVGLPGATGFGYAGAWLNLVQHVRSNLPTATRLMYDLNYTDAVIVENGKMQTGGELARWRNRLAEPLLVTTPEAISARRDLADLWSRLDSAGIDMYRSLASDPTILPEDYDQLVIALKTQASAHATQVDGFVKDLNTATGATKAVVFKELGYRSVEFGFIDPFQYAGPGTLNASHQAAAYEAFFQAFYVPGYRWYDGVSFWDASVDLRRHGPLDKGFSPIGKGETEAVISNYFSWVP